MSTKSPVDLCAKCGGERRTFTHMEPYNPDKGDHPFVENGAALMIDPEPFRFTGRDLPARAPDTSLYLIGSLRNPRVPEVAKELRERGGWDVFDDWYAAGPEADDRWRDYERGRGHDVIGALRGLAAKHVDEFDQHHLDRCARGVLLMPSGKSAHLELGQFVGAKKPSYIILDNADPDRYDVMWRRVTGVFRTVDEFLCEVKP